MFFNVSHVQNGIYQALLVEATTERIAEAYFRVQKPESEVLGIRKAMPEDLRPGKPVMVVPDEFRMEFIREHQRAFLEKMAELEKQGFRSGGWDEKTDRTAIVRPGKREIDNVIVGYMDRDLNIEWEVKVLFVARADAHYLEGTVFVEGDVYPFDCEILADGFGVELHCYSEPGWITGASYEKQLPENVTNNMGEILAVIEDAALEFLSVEELKNEQSSQGAKAVDEIIEDAMAQAATRGASMDGVSFELER